MKKRTYGYVLPSKELRQPLLGKWKIYRQRGKRILSPSGQLKLEWIIFYHTIGNKNASFTAHQFGIARKTLHKWLKRFTEKNLLTLEETKRTPHHKREWMVTGDYCCVKKDPYDPREEKTESTLQTAIRKNNLNVED